MRNAGSLFLVALLFVFACSLHLQVTSASKTKKQTPVQDLNIRCPPNSPTTSRCRHLLVQKNGIHNRSRLCNKPNGSPCSGRQGNKVLSGHCKEGKCRGTIYYLGRA
uniref:Evasin n=1 Tax=Rhipicephalus appendiculatus TaxID=34631 RepID=A0A131Y973_RHIAP